MEKTKKAQDAERKVAGARLRECFEGTRTHIRAGSWNGLEGADISFVGRLSELHGFVCTCCKGSQNYGGER
jgi:hypothetical protein